MKRNELDRLFQDASEQFAEAMARRDFAQADLAANAMLGVAHDMPAGFEQRQAAFAAHDKLFHAKHNARPEVK